jgi:hypothetical protein
MELHVEHPGPPSPPASSISSSKRNTSSKFTKPQFGFIFCPQCDFKTPFDQRPSSGADFRLRSNAKNGLNFHYTNKHLPVSRSDSKVDAEGLEYFPCTQCSFVSFVRGAGRCPSVRKADSLHTLSRHYIDVHEKVGENAEKEALLEQDIAQGKLVQGVDFFTCPKEGCNFTSTVPQCSKKLPGRKVENKRPALCKLGTHYLRTHEFPKSKSEGKHPCLVVSPSGKESYDCPRCEFKAVVKVPKDRKQYTDNVRRVASMSFMRHYVTHVCP